MIARIGVENRNINSLRSANPQSKADIKNPNFKGGGLWPVLLMGIQECEKNPMVNVAVIDMFSAILPRTFVESLTNWFAGFEALRRESSGLIVNCLIPSVITMGCAMGLNKFIMPKGSDLSKCWADSTLITRATEIYSNSKSDNKIKDSLKEILKNVEGYDGKGGNPVEFGKTLSAQELEEYAARLEKLTTDNLSNRKFKKSIKAIAKEITEKTHIFENIKVAGEGEHVKANTLETLLSDTAKYFKEFQKVGKDVNITQFAQNSKKLVKAKSIAGLAIVLPLAASMQYINRWITEKVSGIGGAPIYDDFGQETNKEIRAKSKEGLLKQKIISISSMIGVSLLSMMKMPTWNMFEFKGIFPTMDQARLISTTTFASRMAAADDKNELAEATVRDIATFMSLYFLGDYAAKATATLIENKTGISLLNETKKLDKDAGVLKKFWHWVKDINIKSSEEVISKTAEDLKKEGLTPTTKQMEQIKKELQKAKNLRSACQVANLGVSLLLLGFVIPIFTRNNTKKRHAEALRLAEENSSYTNEKIKA